MLKKMIAIVVMAIMVLGVFGLSGCSNGKTFELDGWTLFEQNGRVSIISADCESLVVDGVLTIPAKIGKYNIYGFGRPAPFVSMADTYFSVAENLEVKRVVLAAELHVDNYFWGRNGKGSSWKYVGFLSSDFMNIEDVFLDDNVGITYIIPDSSMQSFIERFGNENFSSFTVLEKTVFLQETQNGFA